MPDYLLSNWEYDQAGGYEPLTAEQYALLLDPPVYTAQYARDIIRGRPASWSIPDKVELEAIGKCFQRHI